MDWNTFLRQDLERRQADSLYRCRRLVDSPAGVEQGVDGRPMLSFCSNDYLGLAAHPELAQALVDGVGRWGVGSGAAHLVNGHTQAHHALEEELAAFTGRPRALLFSTGYMANLALISALLGRSDTLLADRLDHASLLDGGVLSRARVQRYTHADPQAAEARLGQARGRVLLATDGVFSMDGDLAPLPKLAAACRRYGAWLMVDDAHGLGVLGEHGAGTLEHFGLSERQVPILMGTLGKALGGFGAFVAGSETLVETLIQRARPYIFTTAAPPALAEAVRAALGLVRREAWRREAWRERVEQFRAGAATLGLPLMNSMTPIQPLLVGRADTALAASQALDKLGLLVPAIRPPTVPEGAARLRVTLSAAHRPAQVARLLEGLARVFAS